MNTDANAPCTGCGRRETYMGSDICRSCERIEEAISDKERALENITDIDDVREFLREYVL